MQLGLETITPFLQLHMSSFISDDRVGWIEQNISLWQHKQYEKSLCSLEKAGATILDRAEDSLLGRKKEGENQKGEKWGRGSGRLVKAGDKRTYAVGDEREKERKRERENAGKSCQHIKCPRPPNH